MARAWAAAGDAAARAQRNQGLQANRWVRAYAQLVERQHTAHGDSQPGGFAPPQVDGLKYLAQTVDRARDRYTLLEDIETAGKRLYKALGKDQKTLIDMRLPSIVAPRFPNPKCPQLGY